VFDQGPVRRGLDGHSVLRQPEKQLPAMAGAAAVEAKGELVQVVIQMRARDRALMGTEEPTLE
jgi:hypothetical protein